MTKKREESLLQDTFCKVKSTQMISVLIGKLSTHDIDEIVVFKQDTFYGLIDPYLLLRSYIDVSNTKIEQVTIKTTPIALTQDFNKLDLATQFKTSGQQCLVFEKDQKLYRVTLRDLLAQESLTIQDVKTHECILDYREPISKAIHYFHKFKRRMIVLVDEKKEFYGYITPTLLYQKYYAFNLSSAQTPGAFDPGSVHTKQRVDTHSLPVRNFCEKSREVLVQPVCTYKEAIEKMKKLHTFALIQNTTYQIFDTQHLVENFTQNTTQNKVTHVGLDNVDYITRMQIHSFLQKKQQHFQARISHLQQIRVHIKTTHQEGKNMMYFIDISLYTDKDHYHSKQHGAWNVLESLRDAFDAIDEQIQSSTKRDASTPSRLEDPYRIVHA